ncbi:MAG: metallopeptidase family protein [Patescibacteria group bacterium]
MLSREQFELLVKEGMAGIPQKFLDKIKNVAILVEDEPSAEVRKEEGLAKGETLLGLYRGVPATERGEGYGIGMTLPDTITLYQHPIEEAARGDSARIREEVRDTVWHEIAHYFGMSESEVRTREKEMRRKR